MNKRQWFTTLTLAGLLGTLGYFGYVRLGGSLPAAVESVEADAAAPTPESEGAEGDQSPEGEPESGEEGGGESGVDSPDEAPAPRATLRVVGLGAEAIAPGILAAGGLRTADESSFAGASLDVHLRHVATLQAVERALSLGGDEEDGAHVVVLPLPSFVSGYERVRALAPQIVAVAGWSQGRDALYGPDTESLAGGRSRSSSLCGELGTPETFFGLYLLELAGTSIDDIQIGRRCDYHARDRSSSNENEEGRLIATSADASKLIPWVVVAPSAVFETEEGRRALTGWLRAWFEGVSQVQDHAAESARMIATATESDPVRILQRLGQMQVADLTGNVRAFGLSGRGALNISALFGETWRVWREAGVLVTPAPSSVPVDSTLVTLAARGAERPAPPSSASASFDTSPMLSVPLESEQSEIVHRVGWLADLFPRSAIEVHIPGNERRRTEVRDEVVARYGLAPARLRVTNSRRRKAVVYRVQ